jgi:hypothetical protein
MLLTSQYSIRPICRLNIHTEKFSSNAKTGEFDYLRRFNETENTARKKNGKFNITLLTGDKQSTNRALIWRENTERLEEEMLNTEELGHCHRYVDGEQQRNLHEGYVRLHIRSLWKTENWKADNRTTSYHRSSGHYALKAHGHVVIGFF